MSAANYLPNTNKVALGILWHRNAQALLQCCFLSTETIQTIRDGVPRMSASPFTQPLSSDAKRTKLFTLTHHDGRFGSLSDLCASLSQVVERSMVAHLFLKFFCPLGLLVHIPLPATTKQHVQYFWTNPIQNCLHVLQCNHRFCPFYLSELLHLYIPSCSLCSSSDTPKLQPQTHGFHTFSHFGPHIWNNLPQDTRHCATLLLQN